MPFNHKKAGISHVGSYQVSGRPWITGSADIDNNVQHRLRFPAVAKSVTVINKTSVDLHYITLTEDRDSITFNVRCKEVYITSQGDNGAYEVVAELTAIPHAEMFDLTGSGLTD